MSTTTENLQQALSELFAPWVQALNLTVESTQADSVTLRLPQSDQLSRVGGMLCGQAMMAAADTAMVDTRATKTAFRAVELCIAISPFGVIN